MSEQSKGVSRRTFVAASGAVAAAAVAAGGLGAARADEAAEGTAASEPVTPDYQVYEADVIVIGAGMCAMSAVDEAIY